MLMEESDAETMELSKGDLERYWRRHCNMCQNMECENSWPEVEKCMRKKIAQIIKEGNQNG
jgi:cytochrome c-type biogenesis protein CcmH/NrfF